MRSGVLRAFDASNVANELWNSSQEPDRDSPGTFAKFAAPTIANGRVYLPTFSNQVCVYGLLGAPNPPSQLNAVATSTNGVNLTWKDNSNGRRRSRSSARRTARPSRPLGARWKAARLSRDVSTLIPYATYSYRVRALRGALSSTYSSVVSVALDCRSARAVAPRVRQWASDPGRSERTDDDESDRVRAGQQRHHQGLAHVRRDESWRAAPDFRGSPVFGAGGSDFGIDQAPTGSLAAGATASLTVSFTPPAIGNVLTTLLISSNDPATPTYTFTVGGSGVSTQVGWWQLDDGSGTTALDSSGDGANGTFVGSPSWTTGHVAEPWPSPDNRRFRFRRCRG